MGPIKLDKTIMGTMKVWGGNYDSKVGCNHNDEADKVDPKIDSAKITLNKNMDPDKAKPDNLNPGFDKGFWAKARPLTDTTGHGVLTRKLQD